MGGTVATAMDPQPPNNPNPWTHVSNLISMRSGELVKPVRTANAPPPEPTVAGLPHGLGIPLAKPPYKATS